LAVATIPINGHDSPVANRLSILFAGHSLARPRGGGEISARTLLTSLARCHEVEAICVGQESQTYVLDGAVHCRDHALRLAHPLPGLPFHLATLLLEARFRRILTDRLRAQPPDLLILQQPACLHPGDLPPHTRLIIFMRSLVCYGAADANPSAWRRFVGRPFRKLRLWRNRALLQGADLVISNSRFLQGALQQRAKVDSQVIAPFIDTAALRGSMGSADRRYLTFVGLDAWKGANLAIRLAEALPDRAFLFLEGPRSSSILRDRVRRLSNVTCLGWNQDMGPVFARTRVLLVPSAWEEPFGRLPVEAGACGVPTLASARGGLPESVGDGGLLMDPADELAQWVDGIRQLDDPQVYSRLAQAAVRHAASYDLELSLRHFEDLVRRRLGIELGVGP